MSHGEVLAYLAHDSDPIAIIGFFGPALVLAAIVVALVVYDRKRRGPDREARRAEQQRDVIPPRAD